MKRLSLLGLSMVVAVSLGCGGAGIDGRGPHVYEDAKEIVREAKQGITQISADELREKIENEEMFMLIDVRETDEYYEEMIDGAFNVPRGILEFKIGDERYWDEQGMYVPEKDEELIIYSEKGKRGALATQTLITLGYENVKNLEGGWIVWEYGPDALEEEEEAPVSSGCG
jgi:rhodanese-related sulfurtransferase